MTVRFLATPTNRTVIVHNQIAHIHVGGGIVADSDPQAEWDETLSKTLTLMAGIQAINGDTHEKR